ncbi:F0F1 ATP synthase subunit gamma [Buchnera aphidicola]|uniref:F0F1 ATP synthase subunit gamma n=1 Tax=Buchnera aphidicola TaxID=9 RepID=UPI003463F426
MAVEREIHNKINSIQNTKKITKAMEMISIVKMRKTVARMRAGRPYAKMIKKVINHLIQGNLEYEHSYLENRVTKRIGLVIISTDRGLCGSLNTYLFKKILVQIQKYANKNIMCDLIIFGLKGIMFFSALKSNIVATVANMGDKPRLSNFINSIRIILESYKHNAIDKLFLANNQFKNTITHSPIITQLLPLSNVCAEKKDLYPVWDYLYESDSKLLLDILLNRYIESQIYQAILENIASEQAARTIAMKMATDNSGNLIQELQSIYNKTRQASITRELTEIISGASAVQLN